jgi:hypothetical protein
MSFDWGAVSGAASAAAAVAAVASIALAYRGVQISREGSALNRRNYLDGLFVRWLDSIDALDRAALPYLRHIPTQSDLDARSPDLPAAYNEFHLAFMRCRTATDLLDATGLFDQGKKEDRSGEIATDELIKVFHGVLWTYYFSVVNYSAVEAAEYERNNALVQTWGSAVHETEASLIQHEVPAKYFPLFEAAIRRLYPEESGLGVWQASDRILDFCKTQLARQYSWLVNSRFPWDGRSARREAVAEGK